MSEADSGRQIPTLTADPPWDSSDTVTYEGIRAKWILERPTADPLWESSDAIKYEGI